MDTATLPTFTPNTIADGDTVVLDLRPTGRQHRPTLLARVRYYTAPEPVVTVVILLGLLLSVAGVVAALAWPAPVSPGARWDPQPVAVAPAAHTVPVAVCHEEQPCWDSRYMGNQQAGIGAAHGPVMDEGGVYGCEAGGELVYDNGYGATVCDYSRRFV